MDIKCIKYSGKPVFHAVDPAWEMDNGVNFNFIPKKEAEARMIIAGLILYIRDTRRKPFIPIHSRCS
jgi:hypothetical protein